jgi:hypothetical protein
MFNSGHLLHEINAALVMKYNLVMKCYLIMLSIDSNHYHHFWLLTGAKLFYVGDLQLQNPDSISSVAFPRIAKNVALSKIIFFSHYVHLRYTVHIVGSIKSAR